MKQNNITILFRHTKFNFSNMNSNNILTVAYTQLICLIVKMSISKKKQASTAHIFDQLCPVFF